MFTSLILIFVLLAIGLAALLVALTGRAGEQAPPLSNAKRVGLIVVGLLAWATAFYVYTKPARTDATTRAPLVWGDVSRAREGSTVSLREPARNVPAATTAAEPLSPSAAALEATEAASERIEPALGERLVRIDGGTDDPGAARDGREANLAGGSASTPTPAATADVPVINGFRSGAGTVAGPGTAAVVAPPAGTGATAPRLSQLAATPRATDFPTPATAERPATARRPTELASAATSDAPRRSARRTTEGTRPRATTGRERGTARAGSTGRGTTIHILNSLGPDQTQERLTLAIEGRTLANLEVNSSKRSLHQAITLPRPGTLNYTLVGTSFGDRYSRVEGEGCIEMTHQASYEIRRTEDGSKVYLARVATRRY